MTTKQIAQELYAKVDGLNFDETGHAEPWRNEVAKDLNQIAGRVEYTLGDPNPDETDTDFAAAAIRLIERTAEFEDIEKAPPEKRKPQVKHRS